jgi:D-3-phosphoglycerate dehydrogenase
MTTVLITARSFQKMEGAHWEALQEAGLRTITSGADRPLTAEELAERLPGMAALICGMDEVSATAIQAADTLRVISMNGVGLDGIDVEAATRRGIVVTNTPGTNAESVADLTLALILAQARRIPHHDRSVREGGWKRIRGRELRGQLLGLVGLGQIGKKVALRAAAFGMRIQAYDPYIDAGFCAEHGIEVVDWETALSTSDVLSLHCPVTAETANLINREALAAMKPEAILVNTSRGDLVDEVALIEALESGQLAGAGLDVFSSEPPEPGPLWGMKQVVLTPHVGGNTREAAMRTALQSARNAVAVLTGGRASNVVNLEALHTTEDSLPT